MWRGGDDLIAALDAVADVVAGHADVCAVTAASVLKELAAGRVRLLAISAPELKRAVVSDGPPGGYGEISVMTRLG